MQSEIANNSVLSSHDSALSPRPSVLSPQSSVLRAQHFCLRIADISIGLTSDDPELELCVEGTTNQFLVDDVDPYVRVRAAWGDLAGEEEGVKVFDSGGLWQLYTDEASYHFRFGSPVFGPVPYKKASFNFDFTAGEVQLHRRYFNRGLPVYPLQYPLDELLMICLLAGGRGVEVHACGVVDSKGNGHLFLGQSGAGKTTMARLWQKEYGARILSDDRIILRKVRNNFCLYGTPWHGEAELACQGRAPLTRIYFLRHGEKNELVPQSKGDAVARLFTCSFPPFYDASALDFTLGFLAEIAKTVPCHELRFLPDQRVLDFLGKHQD